MLLLLTDLLIIVTLFVAVIYAANKFIKLGHGDDIEEALQEQQLAAELAKRSEQLNPEQIKANQAKVKETLDKLK